MNENSTFRAVCGGLFVLAIALLGVLFTVGVLFGAEAILRELAIHFEWQTKTRLVIVAITGACVALLIIQAAIVHYITRTQHRRRRSVESYYRPETIAEYLQEFWSAADHIQDALKGWIPGTPLGPDPKKSVIQEFNLILDDIFGSKHFLFPNAVLIIIGFLVLFFAIQGGLVIAESTPFLQTPDKTLYPLGLTVDLVSIAAIFGAYTWIASDAIGRDYQATLNPSHLYWYAMRFAVAIPLGQAVAVMKAPGDMFANSTGAAIAFLISMFSYERISAIANKAVSRITQTPETTPDEKSDLIIKLPGVDSATAEILTMEGITTIEKLASSDLIRIAVRTGFPFDQVVALVDSALLWRYVDDKLLILREFGWVGASNVLYYQDTLDAYNQMAACVQAAQQALAAATNDAARTAAQTTYQAAQDELDMAKSRLVGGRPDAMEQLLKDMEVAAKPLTVAGLRSVIAQVRNDTYAQFIRRLIVTY
jgi:hypothetical protein